MSQRSKKSPKISALLRDVRQALRDEAKPEAAASAQRFFKEPVKAYGVYTPFLKQLVKEIWPTLKDWTAAERFDFCDELWQSGMFEEGILVTHLAEKWAKQSTEAELLICGDWIERYVTNWAACDNLCIHWIALTLKKTPELAKVLNGWEDSPSIWKRRASLAGLIHEVRQGRQHARAKKLVEKLKADPHEMVRKAVVWMQKTLRDYEARH